MGGYKGNPVLQATRLQPIDSVMETAWMEGELGLGGWADRVAGKKGQ